MVMRRALLYMLEKRLTVAMVRWIDESTEAQARYDKIGFAIRTWESKYALLFVGQWRIAARRLQEKVRTREDFR